MISLITGKVGGGKTLLALGMILKDLSKGQGVLTNIALDFEACDKYLKRRLNYNRLQPSQITYLDLNESIDFRDKTKKGTLTHPYNIYIDEAHLFFNAKDATLLKNDFFPLLSYITQSRKLHQNIFFSTQAPETLVNQFRLQTEEGYRCVDMRKKDFPIVGKIDTLGLRWVAYDWSSGQTLRTGGTKIDSLLTNCFDTTQFYDTTTSLMAQELDTFTPITKQWYKDNIKKNETRNNIWTLLRSDFFTRFLGLQKHKEDQQKERQQHSGTSRGKGRSWFARKRYVKRWIVSLLRYIRSL